MIEIPKKARFAVIKKFGSPDVFEIKEQKLPEIKANQLLIKVHAASVNPIDWKQRQGKHRFILGAPFPITLGYDVAGVVVKTGLRVKRFKPGDEVMGVLDNTYGGAYGEYAKGTEKCFVKRPDALSVEQAAAAPMVALTSLQALRDKGNLKHGQTLLINGSSGGVGHVALQIGKIMGAKTIAVSSSKSRESVMQFSPDKYLDYIEVDIITSELKTDVFFDVVGNYSFLQVKHLLNPGGVYINTLPRPKILIHKLAQLFSKGKRVKTLLMKHDPDDLEIIAEWLRNGKLKVQIDQVFSFENIASAHEYAEKGHTKGKNIIKFL